MTGASSGSVTIPWPAAEVVLVGPDPVDKLGCVTIPWLAAVKVILTSKEDACTPVGPLMAGAAPSLALTGSFGALLTVTENWLAASLPLPASSVAASAATSTVTVPSLVVATTVAA